METILLLAHTGTDNALPASAYEALGHAVALKTQLGDARLVVGLIGESLQDAANVIAGCGADTFLGVAGAEFAQARYATDAAAAEAIVQQSGATIIVAPATSRWSRVLAGVSQRLNGRIDTHATGIQVDGGQPVVNRWYYRQRIEVALTRAQRPWIILLDPGIGNAWCGEAGTAAITEVSVAITDAHERTQVAGVQAPAADAQTIRPDAKVLFVAGAGWTKKQPGGEAQVGEAEQLILGFLNASRSSLGSSKSLVDLGGEGQEVLSFLSHMNQIGQTGATPRHPKGLATCCHGEEPHVVGWRFIKERRAVNLDPNCGWAHGKADVLYVADAFAVMRKVNELVGG